MKINQRSQVLRNSGLNIRWRLNYCIPALVTALCIWTPQLVFAQEGAVIHGITITGKDAISLSVEELNKIELQKSAERSKQFVTKIREELSVKKYRRPVQSPNALPERTKKTGITGEDILQTTQPIHSNFAATFSHETPGLSITPPDCMGDVGPTQVCIASNNRLKWYTKPTVCDAPLTTSTTSGLAPLGGAIANFYLDDFFNSVRAGSDVTDPHVHYDRLSQRWFIVAINTQTASNRILIAVSNGPTITATSSFSFYQFAHDQGAPAGSTDAGEFCDFPTLGVDKNALYIGGLIFDAGAGTYIGSSIYVIRKSALLTGSLVMTAFRNVGNTSSNIFCPQGVQSDDPNATVGYYLGVDAANFGSLRYIVVQNPGQTPTITQSALSVQPTSYPEDVNALGSTKPLDGGDDRLLNAMLSVNKYTGAKSIWTSHNIRVNVAGTALAAGDRNAVRWYKLTPNGNTLTLSQSGTLFDNTTALKSYWMGSIAGNGQEHAAAGFTSAGPQQHANATVAGRYAQTAANTFYAPINATNFTAVYNLETTEDEQRWGDYSQTVTDPSDDMTMWTFQEYAGNTDRWAVRAIQLKAPPPATVASVSPIVCNASRVAEITITGQSSPTFNGYFDPGTDDGGPGFARHISVTSTGNVAVSNVVVTSPLELRVSLNFTGATLGSSQTLTITNPDCQSTTFNYTLPASCTGTGGGGGIVGDFFASVEPSSRQIRLSFPQSNGTLRILDASGRLMLVRTVGSNSLVLPANQFARGIYFLEYILSDGSKRVVSVALL